MSDDFLNVKGEPIFDYDYYMNKVDGLTVAVLKGHLLTDWALNRFARLRFSAAQCNQFKARRFKKRARMVKTSLEETSADAHWGLVFTLNEIRNEYAHELEPDVTAKFADLFRIDEELHPYQGSHSADAERLDRALQHCFEFVLSLDSAKLKSLVS